MNTEHSLLFLRQLDKPISRYYLFVQKMSSSSGVRIPPIENERLITIFRPKRISLLFQYALAGVIFFSSFLFYISVAGGFIDVTPTAWMSGIFAMAFAVVLASWIEWQHRNTMLILTTWNVRMRKGIYHKTTKRIFYDDITNVEVDMSSEGRVAGVGSIKIYGNLEEDNPLIEINDIYNPNGVSEIILRFIRTTPEETPWAHLDKEDQLY